MEKIPVSFKSSKDNTGWQVFFAWRSLKVFSCRVYHWATVKEICGKPVQKWLNRRKPVFDSQTSIECVYSNA